MAWVRLKRGNDWGVDYLYHPDRPKSPTGTYSKSSGIEFTEGQPVRVRWPDGSVTDENVQHRPKTTRVSDMGHEYEVRFEFPYIATTSRGVTTWVALDHVDVWMSTQRQGEDT